MSTPVSAFRSFYARLICACCTESAIADRLRSAFETVPRERFLGKGPWRIFTGTGYVHTPTDDPAFLYQDILVALTEDGPMNGQPSLHAASIASVDPTNGETVIHIGAGTGYYTAVLATLVGATGRVIAYEIEPSLAERAAANLAGYSNVIVHARSGSEGPLPAADVVYVSAGATAPLDIWLDALHVKGRLVFPLTPEEGLGGMLVITRLSEKQFAAMFISPALFVPCIGGRDDETGRKLTEAFRLGGHDQVTSLHRHSAPDSSCWFSGEGWWLSKGPA
jgi:protein-L-isoaspartate(D-aspartate) O-methyltransferase